MTRNYRLIVKPNNLGKWEVYDRDRGMTYAPARTKSNAVDKARNRAEQLADSTGKVIGIEKRTKTGNKSYETVEPAP